MRSDGWQAYFPDVKEICQLWMGIYAKKINNLWKEFP